MRLFIGIGLTDDARRMAEQTTAELRRRIQKKLTAAWVPVENMHLTVRFIGHVGDDRAERVIDIVSQPLDFDAFSVGLGGCGRFPPRGAPRVLWIGVTDGLPSLAALHAEFDRRLAPLGFEAETRPYNAHLTLARVKNAPSDIWRQVDAACNEIDTGRVRQRVDTITVFESRLSPHGARYTPLRTVALR